VLGGIGLVIDVQVGTVDEDDVHRGGPVLGHGCVD
jgi:hypothetical protein